MVSSVGFFISIPVRFLGIKNDIISVVHAHWNWRFMKRNGKYHSVCKVLPPLLLPPFSLLLFFLPQDTHIPLPVSLSSLGASGECLQGSGHCRQCFRQRGRETVLVFWINNTLPSRFAHSNLTLHKTARLFHYQIHINLSWGFQSCRSRPRIWYTKT